jgi:hypothetical protein
MAQYSIQRLCSWRQESQDNKALHRMSMPLRSIAVGEHDRSAEKKNETDEA